MSWTEFQENWALGVDLIVLHFPNTDRFELLKMDGDLVSFTRYLSRMQDLTFKEAMEAIDFVLLKDHAACLHPAKAA